MKNKMLKKLTSIIICILLLASIIPLGTFTVSAEATSGSRGTNVTWSYDTSTNTLTISGTGVMSDYDHYSYNHSDVITTAPWGPYYNVIRTLVIKNGITSIGKYSFFNCSSITSITIPNSVTSIGIFAFSNCTGLTSITIGNSVKSIGQSAFSGCTGLTSITIPNSVTSIGNSAFRDCTGLKKAGPIGGNYNYKFGWEESIPNYAFCGCTGLTSITIPDSVTSIGSAAFRDCTGLTSITIPDTVTSIGGSAFSGCTGLTSITIPDTVTSIGGSAFYNCTGLTSITIPDTVTSIGRSAFYGCTGLTSITIPDTVTFIGGSAFENCTGLTSITIGNSVTSIGDNAFYYCTGLTSVTIPDSVTSIGYVAFYGCAGLTNLTIGNSVTSIGYSAFRDCTGLTSITIPDSVTSIGNCAFYGCKGLTSITIPDTVTFIGGSAFENCTGLTSITIGNSVKSIGQSAFSGCTGLASITIPESVTSIDSSAIPRSSIIICDKDSYAESFAKTNGYPYLLITQISNCGEKTVWFVYNNTLFITGTGETENYKSQGVVPWYEFSENIQTVVIAPDITKIGTYSFYCLNNLKNIICQNKDTAFGRYSVNAGNNTSICAQTGGAAQQFATDNGIGFVDLTPVPELESKTANTITVNAVSGYKYSINGGTSWQTSGTFSGLSPAKEYIIYARLIAANKYIGGLFGTPLTTQTLKSTVSAPAKPVCISNTDTTITITPNESYEFSLDGVNWQKSNVFEGLIHRNTYSIYQRVAETDTEYASEASPALIMQLVKKTVSAPNAPDYLSHTADSITVVANPAYEYSLDGENWQALASFDNLSKNVIYRIYARVAETDTEYASAPSKPLIIALPGTAQIVCGSDESLSVKAVEGFEYCIDDLLWQDSPTFNMLLEDTSYTVYQRLKAIENEKVYQITSDPALFTTSNTLPKHDYIDEIISSTCVARGFTKHTCKNCGYSYNDTYTEIAGHTEVIDKAVAPTCTATGLNEGKHCSVCNAVLVAQTYVPALGHDKIHHDTKNPTCTEKGWNAYDTCSRCDYTTYSEIAPLGHDYKTVVTNPTCTEKGYTTHTCSRCQDSYVDTYTDALGHDWDDGVVTTPPTCTANGVKTYTCKHDNSHTYTEPIKATGHTEIIDKAVEPTCTATGLTEGKHCSVCKAVLTAQTVVPALGHTMVNGKCSVCGYIAVKVNFPDVSYSAWYGNSVAYAVSSGLMKGYANGKFGTSDGIQRQDFVVILARLSGDDIDSYAGKSSFKDVPTNAYYATALAWAKAKGVSNGYQDGSFGVGDKVTREQIMTFLYNYAKLKGYDTTVTDAEKAKIRAQYSDFVKVSSYAKEATYWALKNGVISGKQISGKRYISPGSPAQRCEVAAMFYNINEKGIFAK